jgi:hypothetical protein
MNDGFALPFVPDHSNVVLYCTLRSDDDADIAPPGLACRPRPVFSLGEDEKLAS